MAAHWPAISCMAAAVNLRVPALPRTAGCWSQPRSQRSKERGRCSVVLSLATQIQESWLREMFPDDFEERTMHIFDKSQNRVVVRRRRSFAILSSTLKIATRASPEATACLAKAVVEGVLTLNGWDDSVEQWIARVDLLAEALPSIASPKSELLSVSRSFISPVKAPQITANQRPADPQPRSIAPHARTPASH